VALAVDEDPLRSGPVGHNPAEGGQQHVIDVGAVGAGHVPQERPGLVGGEAGGEGLGIAGGGGAGGVAVGRQGDGGGGGDRRPVGQLVIEAAAGGAGLQRRRPVAERGGLLAQGGRLAGGGPGVGGAEVLQQDPPRHPVDDQVVGRQQQLRPAPGAEGEQDRFQQRPGGQVEPGVHLRGRLLDGGRPGAIVQVGQVTGLQQPGRGRRRVVLPPGAIAVGLELHPQRVMMAGQRLQGGLERGHVHPGVQLQHDPLVEVPGLGRAGLQEPPLHRRQRHRPAHRPLISRLRRGRRDSQGERRDGLVQEDIP
jgi:hypothetical protein